VADACFSYIPEMKAFFLSFPFISLQRARALVESAAGDALRSRQVRGECPPRPVKTMVNILPLSSNETSSLGSGF
jgi:hypothetical protein